MRKLRSIPLLALLAAIALAPAASADPGPFAAIGGTWKGTGEVVLEGGRSEQIRCNAYYVPKEGGSSLGLAIRCASQSYAIELRSQLSHDGKDVSGDWEERNFNAAGKVTGRASATSINLKIVGGAFTGSMQVSTTGSNQTVSINTNGSTLQGVSIKLSRT